MTLSVVYSNFCGRVVSETRNGVESDYVCDTQGSTIGLLDASGGMTDSWEYWPYGEVISHTGSSATPLTFLGVIGYFQDVLSKLTYVRARHLKVDLARWLTQDPLWPTEKPYAYCHDAPIANSDPSGLSCWSDFQKCTTDGAAVIAFLLSVLLIIVETCELAIAYGDILLLPEYLETCASLIAAMYSTIAATEAFWLSKCNLAYYACKIRAYFRTNLGI